MSKTIFHKDVVVTITPTYFTAYQVNGTKGMCKWRTHLWGFDYTEDECVEMAEAELGQGMVQLAPSQNRMRTRSQTMREKQ